MKRSNKTSLIKGLTITLLLALSIFLIFVIVFNRNLQAKTQLVAELSLTQKQHEIDKTISSSNYTIDNPNIILNPYEISPLTALIIFETENQVAPQVTIKGRSNSEDITHQFEKNTEHYLPIYGLYPNSVNDVTVTIEDKTYTYPIETATLPKDLENLGKDTFIDKESIDLLNKHFYFVTPASTGYTSAYDLDGEVRWYLTEKMVWDIKRLNNGNLLVSSERLINPPYYTTGLTEISPLGKIYNEFTLPGGYHHDAFELENGNLIVASNNFIDQTVEDYIVEVDRSTGDIVKSIDLKDILETDQGKSANWVEYDWFHNNSVWYDDATNSLTLSGRHQDTVVNIDYDSLAINYIVGDPETFSKDYQKHFLTPIGYLEWPYSQHAAEILPDGKIFIFDNGNNRSKIEENYVAAKDNYSRGVIYDIDTDNMTISQVYQYGKERGSDYYSSYISDVDYLNNDHYLIHSGGVAYDKGEILNNPPGLDKADKLVSYTTEVLNDQKIFELILENNNYRAEKMTIYSTNEKYENKTANRLGGLEKTEVTKTSSGLLFKTITDEKVLDNYDLDLKKEVDRLVVSGNFQANDEVYVILYNNFSINKYHIRVSKQPYTAMCIDIFNEDEKITINKYINDEGLKGKYNILLEINQKIYKTDKFIQLK